MEFLLLHYGRHCGVVERISYFESALQHKIVVKQIAGNMYGPELLTRWGYKPVCSSWITTVLSRDWPSPQ